jgi:Secretion system C-terminal sorting domain
MKNIFVALISLVSLISTAQMTLKKLDGTPINNGDVLTFDVAEEPGSYLGIKIFNSSANPINVKAKVESVTNSDGTNVQFCLGDVCLGTVTAGNSYPPNFPAFIDANSENGDFDHFLNLNSGINPNLPVSYSFKFYQVDGTGAEVGNSVSFSYRFVGPLGVSNFNQLEQSGVVLKSNIVSNELEMSTTKDLQYTLFDTNGKAVLSQNLEIGNHVIDFSNFSTGIYILSYQNKEGQNGSIRIVKK